MPYYEFEVYIEGDSDNFEKKYYSSYHLFKDGILTATSGQLIITSNREAISLGAAIDSALYGVKQCGGKVTHIDLKPSEVMLVKSKRYVAEKKG